MKVISAILLVLLVLYGIINLIGLIYFHFYAKKAIKRMDEIDLDDPDQFLEAAELVFGPVEEKFENATLLVTEQYAKDTATIYDFSLWEDKKIIGVTAMHKNVKSSEENDERIGIVPNQTVCRFKDGTILWIQ